MAGYTDLYNPVLDAARLMKRILKVIAVAVGIPVLFLIGCIAADQIPRSRATPPASVTDVSSCLAWLKEPMGAYRINVDGAVYYLITGPAGRFLPSGPAGYTFDSGGRFIGWSSDIGDFKTPPQIFTAGAKREKITVEELRRSL
jgi:hypothetical protein